MHMPSPWTQEGPKHPHDEGTPFNISLGYKILIGYCLLKRRVNKQQASSLELALKMLQLKNKKWGTVGTQLRSSPMWLVFCQIL